MKFTATKLLVAGAIASAVLSGCVVAPYPGYADVAVSYQEPPPVQYEVVGVAPSPGYLWIGGAWFWEGGRYAWRPGHWDAPRPGYHWVPHTWRHVGNSWHMQGGRWDRDRR